MSYDAECYNLAMHFLKDWRVLADDPPKLRAACETVAEKLQAVIEAEIADLEARLGSSA